jgi:tRNA(Glu) U13 pseudouridine synthase TruD
VSGLIPRLTKAVTGDDREWVSADFAAAFRALHGTDDRVAQNHWERIVERVLNTDAVEPNATGRKAMRQAVRATVVLLERSDLRGRCPVCAQDRAREGRLPRSAQPGEVPA